MAYFLTQEDIYKILQQELPENVYPEGSPSKYYSTAENDSVAKTLSSAYDTLESIYLNEFPLTTTEEKINSLEVAYFNEIFSGLTLQQRIDKVIAKVRAIQDLSLWQIQIILCGLLPNTWIEVIQKNKKDDPVILSLDTSTFTKIIAFTYDVIIYNYNLITEQKALIEATLKTHEPARSSHNINYLADDAASGTIEVTKFDLYNRIKYDSAQQKYFGYNNSGWFSFFEDATGLGFGDDLDITKGGYFTF